MIISLIAAMDENRGIGKNNQLLCHLPADLKHFKALTVGKPVIMGKRTFESIGCPLPDRLNIVISHTLEKKDDVKVLRSLSEALQEVSEAEEVMIIGGERLFNETIEFADRIYLTIIHTTFEADVFFPLIDTDRWLCTESIYREKDEKNPYDLTFCTYERPA
ncbi:dihydrofolate reductase [Legionella impletisoli]|uniref:Dihydrofolate reductase n=1 Tax=Legionella impletisoli TaxID=343510 RepID=A0A917K1E5_9GAMM|nr:dihydrofolate reductase [Legionella impletisoli]GGI93357.1 dihydrofolate reductase [Legionella impletisoli]